MTRNADLVRSPRRLLSIHLAHLVACCVLWPSADALASDPCSASEQGKVLAVREGDVLKWTDCTNGPLRQEFEVPSRAAVFPSRTQVLAESYKGNFNKVVTKLDIIWADQTIEITKPLRSFGGDIILFADRIVISAPIDSRVYFEHGVHHFAPDRRIGSGPECSFILADTSVHIKDNPLWQAAYRDFHMRSFDIEPGETRRPELPSGFTAPSPPSTCPQQMPANVPGEALAESDVLWPSVRSGNVWIFANKIEVDPKYLSPKMPAERADCLKTDLTVVKFALNAGGLRGSRGGAGSASRCPRPQDPNNPFGCKFIEEPGGLSAPGGKGGDAGDVLITILTDVETEFQQALRDLPKTANARGGEPGTEQLFRSPATAGPLAVTNDRCSFRPESKGTRARDGMNGRIAVVRGSKDTTMVPPLLTLLQTKESRSDYDYFALAHLFKADVERSDLRPLGVFSRFAAESLQTAQLSLVTALLAVFVDRVEVPATIALPTVLRGVKAYATHDALLPEQVSIMNELRKLDAPLSVNMLQQSGGLFHVLSRDSALTRMREGQLRASVSISNLLLTEIGQELRQVNAHLFRASVRTSRRDLLEQLQSVAAAIQAAEDAARKAQEKNNDYGLLVADLVALGQGIAKVVAGIASENYLEVGAGIVQTAQATERLAKWGAWVPMPELPELRKQLEAIKGEMVAFEKYVGFHSRAAAARELGGVFEVIKRRQDIRSKLISESFLFQDLLKVAIIGFTADKSGNRADLRSNLHALSVYLSGFPYQEPFVHLSDDIQWDCADPTVCKIVEANTNWNLAYTRVSIGAKTVEIPLYVLKPTRTRYLLPLFGLDPAQALIRRIDPPDSSR